MECTEISAHYMGMAVRLHDMVKKKNYVIILTNYKMIHDWWA